MFSAELVQIVHSIWETVIGLEISAEAPTPRRAGERSVTGCIQLSGAWSGAIIANCSEKLARRLAAAMMASDEASLAPEEVLDAVGEMVNMIGGNVKALLPKPCQLSLPSVTDGTDVALRVPRSEEANKLHFRSGGEILTVTLLQAVPASARAQ